MRTVRHLAIYLVPLLAAGCFNENPQQQKAAQAKCVSPEDQALEVDRVLELVNLERTQRNLPPVVPHARLTRMAEDFACQLVERNFFAHEDPETGYGPAERAVLADYRFFTIGENLAAGQQTAADVMRVWMESDDHRRIILDPIWKEVGIAVRDGGEFGSVWVQEFGDPADY